MKIYIIKSHDGRFLNKDLEWLDGSDANLVYNAPHRDVALNAKDINLRAQIIECEADKKGRPVLLLEASAIQSSTPANVDQTNAA